MHHSAQLHCAGFIFGASDVNKTIEIPTGGSAGTSPAPVATVARTISSIASTGTCANGLCSDVTLCSAISTITTGVHVTWGTDNSAAFTAAANACTPTPAILNLLGNFTSKGCTIVIPSPGTAGTGDYMFTTGVVMSTQTSFSITGMGNSARAENSTQSGVRLVTAMPITILTVGISTTSNSNNFNSNFGGFQISDLSFIDTSQNGSALGGLLIYNTSNAIISDCDFENFGGQTADPANTGVFPNILA